LYGLSAAGQQPQYKFSQLNVSKGLSDSRVKCFLKDQKGFIWVGTFFGLNRFDGYSLKVFRNDPRDTTTLSQSDINKLQEDPWGRIFITTYATQNVYDPVTEKFSRNTNAALDDFGIPHGQIRDIVHGDDNRYWFSHTMEGLFLYSKITNNVVHYAPDASDTLSIHSKEVSWMAEDGNGGLWIIHRDGIFERLDIATGKIARRNGAIHRLYGGQAGEYSGMVDTAGDLWIYLINSNKGVFHFNKASGTLTHLHSNSKPVALNENIVRGIVQDDDGLIWVATDHGGINIIDKKKQAVQYVYNNEEDDKSLGQNSVNVLYKDRDGFIWAGTFKKGVSYYHKNLIRFDVYRHQTSNPRSLPNSDINAFAEDEKGNLWIGTNGQGLIYFDRKLQTFTAYKHDPHNENSLSGNVIVSLFVDRQNKLWIGTYFTGLNCYDGKRFTRYRHSDRDEKSLADDNVWEIFEDSQKRLWIGTMSQGVDILDRNTNSFIHYKYGKEHSVHTTYIPTIQEDKEGNVWFGTGYGLDVLMKDSNDFIHYVNDVHNPKSLGHNNIFSLLADNRNNMWIGTTEGLNLFDRKTGTFRVFTTEQGLPHSTILSLQEDNNGNLWIGTSDGISNMILSRGPDEEIISYQFRNYSESDGLQAKQFNEGASIKTRKGEMVFGGSYGFNLFDPATIRPNKTKPQICLSDFQILNKSVKVGEEIGGQVILSRDISFTDRITLDHANNVFSLEFAALSFFTPEKISYKYMLKGFNKDWLFTDANARKVTYTNLDPGEYTFVVKSANSDGVWNEEGLELPITILPPFWKTKTAFVLYVLIILGALFFSRQIVLQRERMKYGYEKERREAQQIHELDLMKIKFFTNVSHEFRTPLSLIIAPLEKILKHSQNAEQKAQFQMIHRNARRLLNMVNQLLDFRKMEVQEVMFVPAEGDIIEFIKETASSFSDLSDKNHIHFSVTSNIDHLETCFDKEKLEKILFNLLSNAFKFTPEGGRVGVVINVLSRFESVEKWLEIKVSDTGIGIPVDKQERIFERFFQSTVPPSMINQGSGIGLSITREFVKAHQGTITVESQPEKGSCFTVSIPVPEISAVKSVVQESETEPLVVFEAITDQSEPEEIEEVIHHDKPVLLLVEDSTDFRFYLKDNLKAQYCILEARNGKEAYALALQKLPDLIVSDVMMPEMDGMELCKKIKTEKITSHIPVILLTARTAEEQKIEGFETGADDYITKPFSFEILQSRIKNLIHQREAFHKSFRKQIEIKASDIAITSLDEKLIQSAIKLVEDNISNVDFSVETLSVELGISRVQLYKKLLSLTGKAPLEFIRTIRIQRAAQLLEKSQFTVSQVAYEVGFNNPKYFTKYFKDEFNILPSAFASSKRRGPVTE
jgi:signal transduction histidine kinase/ligand-binding sensor domain-containing protein/DNA-binding response OmpR family regulator